jgi:hypothetical protein
MIVQIDLATAAHVRVALAAHLRAMRRDGVVVPAGLADLAEQLEPERIAARMRAERPNRLAAARNRRSRARKRGENIPLRKPGPWRRSA